VKLPAFLGGTGDELPIGEQLLGGFQALRAENDQRIGRYRTAEDRYARSRDEGRVSLGDHDDYGRPVGDAPRNRHAIPLNYDHAITQKHSFRIAGRLPDVLVPGNDRSKYERFRSDTIEKLIYGVWRYSDIASQFASGAHHASLLGAACFDVWLDPSNLQIPKVRELHPGTVLVVPGIDDIHDFEAVYRFWPVSIRSLREKYRGVDLPHGGHIDDVRPTEDGGGSTILVELITRDNRVRFAGKTVLSERPHTYGFAPYIIIPNLGPVEELWGFSDHEFYKDAVAYLERLISRQADVAATTANGAMQDLGSGQHPSKVLNIIRKGGIVPGKKDSKGIQPIQPPEFGAWIDSHHAFIRQAINDLGFTPDAAWGTIGASTSGSDRALQLGPQLELTGLKQIHWSGGIKRMNTMILKLIEKYTVEATFRGTATKGYRSSPFTIVVNAAAAEAAQASPSDIDLADIGTDGAPKSLPQTPKELIAGDYCTEVKWNNRLDRDDPQFVLSELNKYAQAAQSLYTTLERLGFADPSEEIELIAAEAEKYPWLRSGMISLIKQQLDAAANTAPAGGSGGGGGQGDISGALASLTGGGGGASGALGFDAQSRALNGSARGVGGKDQGRVPGAPNGGA
jgi:hypothetical protein